MATPPGGPSTINGVLYQMLWSLLRAAMVRVSSVDLDGDKSIVAATLVLEPSTGGDLRIVERFPIVEQVKTRSDGGTWSLREIVEDVLPDLYLAARNPTAGTRYHFVTDGRIGRWPAVSTFFQSLAGRGIDAKKPLACLDNEKELPFQTSSKQSSTDPFWDDPPYTERRLVERIVEEVRKRSAVKTEDLLVTQLNTVRMLSALDFTWGQSVTKVQQELDSCLAAVVANIEKIPETRRSLAMALAELATTGDAEIDPIAFFKSHTLDAIPLSHWASIRSRATTILGRELALRRYVADADVRAASADSIAAMWNPTTPIISLSAETGYGKTWQLFALAQRQTSELTLTIYIEARGDADHTLAAAGRMFSEEVWGVDQALSLARLAQRRKEFYPHSQWLTLVIDNVQEVNEAKQLALKPWEDWGIRVIIGCHPSVSSVIERTAVDRVKPATICEFSLEETHAFLEKVLPMGWSMIPQDVVEMLRRPLLAHLYVDTVANQQWVPTNEYELYAAYWERIHQGVGSQYPLDEAHFKVLIRGFLDGHQYPWTDSQLIAAGVDNDTFSRLDQAGWLIRTTDGLFTVPHDRLLNWAVAVTLLEMLHQGQIDIHALGGKLRTFSFGDQAISGKYLGYTAMDVVWMLAQHANKVKELVALIPLLEEHHVQTEDLYTELLPTIGPSIVRSLFQLLRERNALLYFQRQLIEGLCKLGGDEVDAEVLNLLDSGDTRLQRYACLLLAKRPNRNALEKLWAIHQEILVNPEPWLEEHDSKYFLRDQSFDALKACCLMSPQWLADKAASSDPSTSPCSELAYLIGSLPSKEGRRVWEQAKTTLMEKVPAEKHRSIAMCMGRFPDDSHKEWLLERLPEEHDHLGLASLQSLVRVEANLAVANLHLVPRQELWFGRNWWFAELVAQKPKELGEKIREMMRAPDGPWDMALCYENNEHLIEPATLEILLDRLLQDVDACLGKSREERERLFRELKLLAAANTVDQIKCLQKRRGTKLEFSLQAFLEETGAQNLNVRDSHVRDPAMEILYRIGGDSFTSIANSFIGSESQYGRLEGLDHALKRPNAATITACAAHVLRNDRWSGGETPLEQNHAAAILAASHRWEALVPFFEKWWPHVFTTVTDPLESEAPLPDQVRDDVRRRIEEAGTSCSPALPEVLGFSQNANDIPTIRDLLAKMEPESDLATACLLAIDRLGDHSEESVSVLERFLEGKSARLARIALTTNGSEEARAALLNHYETHFDLALGVNLLNHASTANTAVGYTKRHLSSLTSWFWSNELETLLTHVRDPKRREQLFDAQELRDRVLSRIFAQEGRSWIGGSKAAAIRAVSIIDRQKAIQATSVTLANTEAHDRDLYPYLLVDLAGDEAVSPLLELLGNKKSKAVQASIGRALSTIDCSVALLSRLTSEETQIVVGACRAIGFDGQGKSLSTEICRLLGSGDNEIIVAATAALLRLRKGELVEHSVSELKHVSAESDKWIVLDGLLELADPGDRQRKLPKWGVDVWEDVSPFMRHYAVEKLTRRRDELFKQLSKDK